MTSTDLERAKALCKGAADRLRAAHGYDDVVGAWPAPIAHEVSQLLRLLDEEYRSPEAALMQLRDVSEVLVKFPASVLAMVVIAEHGNDAARIRKLLAKARGGGWNELAREAAQCVESDSPYAALARLFAKNSHYNAAVTALTQARNDTLGHGAMHPNPAETAQTVAKVVEERLIQAIESGAGAQPWQGLHLEAEAKDDGTISLMGAEPFQTWLQHDDQHALKTYSVRLTSDDGRTPLVLEPLVAARICGTCGFRDVFLFDTLYTRKPWKFDVIDYVKGHKSRLNADKAPDLVASFSNIPVEDLPELLQDGGLESGAVITALDRLRIDRRYLSPTYLRDGLARFLKESSSGIYWLQAPAHIGKTTFVQGLSEPGLDDSSISADFKAGYGGAIATYYCKREYRQGQITFLNGLADHLKTALNLRSDSSVVFPAVTVVLEAEDKRQAFLTWLNAWRAIAPYPRTPDSPLLIVIDGLDEADPPATSDSLIDLLPPGSVLPQGLYILLTSRPIDDDDCPQWLGPAINQLGVTRTRSIDVGDTDYRALLLEYSRKALGNDTDTALIERLIEQAKGRFVYLSFLVEQLRGGNSAIEGLKDFGTGKHMYRAFIDGLEDRYGAKRADTLTSILACLSAAELAHDWIFEAGAVPDPATGGILEPLARSWPGLQLDELAAATDLDERAENGKVGLSSTFVEALFLLQGTLWTWRGSAGESHYRLGLKDFSRQFLESRPDEVRAGYTRLATLCLDAIEVMQEDSQSDVPVHATARSTVRGLFPLLPATIALAKDERLHERFVQLPVFDVAAQLLSNVGDVGGRRDVLWCDALLAAMERGGGASLSDLERNAQIASFYVRRGNAKQGAPGYGAAAAIADYDLAIALREELRRAPGAQWPPAWRNELAGAYMNRGNAKQDAPGYGAAAAIADYDLAIALQEELRKTQGAQWPPAWRNDLAMAYMNRGVVKQGAPGYGAAAAIADCDLAIALREELRKTPGAQWPPAWRNDLAMAYMNRGVAKQDAPGEGAAAAIADYDLAIALQEELRTTQGAQWPPAWRNELAGAYMNRGNAKQDAPGYGAAAAIADYDLAI
ncbi:MAG: P-loop domain-containing protein, partial [Vulcanimicrobiaceae bacterium]